MKTAHHPDTPMPFTRRASSPTAVTPHASVAITPPLSATKKARTRPLPAVSSPDGTRLSPHSARLAPAVWRVNERLLARGRPPPYQPNNGFPRFHEGLRLTDPDSQRRSLWRLPPWFHPAKRPSALSYHGRSDRWQWVDGAVQLATVGRGQEFVLNTVHYPEAGAWLRTLFTDSFSHRQASSSAS